jgi:outer membrane protein OmpA-like peptidoglycan-associated protein
MKILVFIALALSCTTLFAQGGKLKKADNYYQKVSYYEASELYLDLLGSEIDSPKLRGKLANCYYQIGETVEAEKYYSEMISSDIVTSENIYNYAQSLKENGKYDESNRWMEKFHSLKTDDSRGKQFIQNKTYVQEIESQGAYFSINHLKMNSENAEFGGYPYQGKAYFVSNRTSKIAVQRYHLLNNARFLDLYLADVDTGKELVNPTLQPRKVNKKFHEGPLCFSPDGKTVYFTRNNMSSGSKRKDEKGIQNLKIYTANVGQEDKWENIVELDINSKEYSVGHPVVSVDGKTLYFASDMPGGEGGADIYKMSIEPDGTFGKPENLGAEINTEGQEMFPWITSEGLLFFSSDGHLGLGGLDVFAMLPNKDGSFKKLINVGMPINSATDDFALIMNKDNVSGYVSSNRSTGAGNDDIYAFTLLRPLKVNLSLKGIITDVRTNEILPGATVELVNENGDVLASTQADENGGFEFGLEPDLNYQMNVRKEDYFDNSGSVTTIDLPKGIEVLEKDLALEKDPGLSLYALITDAKTNLPLDSVMITVIDNMTGEKIQIITDAKGDYLRPLTDKKLDDRGSYNIGLSKNGYIPKVVTYNAVFDKEGQYDVHSDLDLTLDPMVTDLAQLIEINPINFDLNKSIIRPDAKVELDKIVEVMNKYPGMVVELGSHTDCRASKSYNEKLSDRRAKASAAYIKTKITKPERIYGKGYGEALLLNGCECEGSVKSDCSEEEHEKNRRTEFKVISVGDPTVGVQNNSTDSFGN